MNTTDLTGGAGTIGPFRRDIRPLTSIRMAAATWVVFFHLTHFTGCKELTHAPLVTSGYLGVDFFFVLSGFVLTHVYQPQIDKGRFDYWGFIVRRFARIYPMHLLTLLAFLVIGFAGRGGWFVPELFVKGTSFRGMEPAILYRAFFANLTLIHAWGSTNGLLFNMPSWSISAEWFAYLLFPVFVLMRALPPRGEGGKLAVVLGVFFLMALVLMVVLRGELTRLTWNLGVLRIFPEFLIGMSLHRFGGRWTAGARGSVIGFAASFGLVVVALVAATFVRILSIPLATIAVMGLAGIVFFAADADRHGRLRLLSSSAGVYLGEISYSIYMVHFGVGILLFNFLLPEFRPTDLFVALATVVATLVLVTAVSALTYRFIEVPCRDWIVRKAGDINGKGNPSAS